MNMDLKDEIIQRVVKERLGEPNGIYKRHIHQDLVKEMMEQYHQSKVNNGVLDDVSKQSELLKGFANRFNESSETYILEGEINNFLKTFNCG